MKNAKFIYLLLVLILSFQMVHSQTDDTYAKLKTKMWSDPDFKVTELPDKWKNESAVILAKSYEYEARKEVFFNYIYENTYFHKRIKLLDKAAINEFSELSFENDFRIWTMWARTEVSDVSIGIKVIKPNGKENIIDQKEAVLNEIKAGINKKQYKKVAVPDLEIGDIIDYFYVTKNRYMEQYIKLMDPVFYQFVDEYPIVLQKMKVRVLRQIYFNSKSINGAPDLKRTEKDEEISYTLVDKDREKVDSRIIWAYPYRIYPTIKFQAFFITKKFLKLFDYLNFFLKDKKTNTTNLDSEHISDLVKRIYKSEVLDVFQIHSTLSYLKKNFDKNTPTDTIVKYAYYHLRKTTGRYNSIVQMINMSRVLEGRKIPHDLVITIPNDLSDVSDLILPTEMAYLLRIKGKPDYFIGDFSFSSTFKSINKDYQGNNAYAVSNTRMVKKPKTEKIVIPIDNPDWNKQINDISVKFVENNEDSLQITIDKTSTGIAREEDIFNAITNTRYWDEVSKYLDKTKTKERKKSAKELKEAKLKKDQEEKDCETAMMKYYKNEFDAGDDFKIDSYKVIKTGILDIAPKFEYTISFKVGNLVKKMGANYLISIGKIITSQLELNKKDMERKVDIFAPYPRVYEYKIAFEIPKGYSVKGLEKLNINVTNATGGFTSKADIQNDMLVIQVKKCYEHKFEKAAEWPKMTEFIEAAYNFTQQNILFEKQ